MSQREPPEWSDDALSTYFRMAEYNDRAFVANYPRIFDLLKRTNAALEAAEALAHRDRDQILLIPRFLLVRVRSAFLAACRLALSGQLVEAHAVLRVGVEEAWYALHIAKQPPLPPPQPGQASVLPRWEIWLRRTDDATARQRCKNEFTVRNVRTTHEQIDPATAAQLHMLYETLIDFGAHPNEQGLLAAMVKTEGEREIEYQVAILAPHELPLMMTLRLAIGVAVGALKIFQRIFPERFELMNLDVSIDELVTGLNTSFRAWVPRDERLIFTFDGPTG